MNERATRLVRVVVLVLLVICCYVFVSIRGEKAADATQMTTFSVTVPKQMSTSCSISVAADIVAYDVIKVDVPSEVELTCAVSGTRDSVDLSIDKSSFNKTDIAVGDTTANIVLDTDDLLAGQWKGGFTIDIYVSDVPLEDALNDWEYTLSGDTIYLTKYVGASPNVTVYAHYQKDGVVYNTVVKGNYVYDGGTGWRVFNSDATVVTSVECRRGVVISCGQMFYGCSNLESVELANARFSGTTTLNKMFYQCASLKSIKFGDEVDFSGITDISEMFWGCTAIESIDFGNNFNADGCTNIAALFRDCANLTSIKGVDNWNTSSVTEMQYLLSGCNAITDISFLANWDTSNVTNMSYLFNHCSSLSNISPLANWNVSNVKDMSVLFDTCSSLSDISPLTSWDVHSVTTMWRMFHDCKSLDTFAMPTWQTNSLTNMANMFEGNSVNHVDLRGLNLSHVTNMSCMCVSGHVQTFNAAGCDVSSLESIGSMFCYDGSLQSVDITGWNAPKLTSLGTAFFQCSSLAEIKGIESLLERDEWVSTDFRCAFSFCDSLQSLDLSKWRLKCKDTLYYAFYKCQSLQTLDVSGFDTSAVVNMCRVFDGCSSLTEIKGIGNWNTANVKSFAYMFLNCGKLQSLDLANWSDANVIDNSGVESNGSGYQQMFMNCCGLQSLNISGFTNPNKATCEEMLVGIWGGIHMDVSGFDFANASSIENILYSSNFTLTVKEADYAILQAEIDAERAEAPENTIYTVLELVSVDSVVEPASTDSADCIEDDSTENAGTSEGTSVTEDESEATEDESEATEDESGATDEDTAITSAAGTQQESNETINNQE